MAQYLVRKRKYPAMLLGWPSATHTRGGVCSRSRSWLLAPCKITRPKMTAQTVAAVAPEGQSGPIELGRGQLAG